MKKIMLDKNLIMEATQMSNLSQWVQMEIWKYYECTPEQRQSTEIADRIIKHCNKELITKIKKALPTHPDGMISRNEVKKILNNL